MRTENDARGHQYDYELVKNLIGRGARYLGMIGSNRKVNILSRDLKEKEGISSELIEGLHAPIGLDISADTPEEIAVAIAAEIIVLTFAPDFTAINSFD